MEKIPQNSQKKENNIDLDYNKYPNEIDDNNEENSYYTKIHKNYNLLTFDNNKNLNQMNKEPILIKVKDDSFLYKTQKENSNFINQYDYKMKKSKIIENKGPKDNLSKKKNLSSRHLGKQQKYFSFKNDKNRIKKIPKFISFKQNLKENKENINLNITTGLVDIPRSEYGSYAGKDITFMGGGMETGEYKFGGSKIIMKEKLNQKENIVINEEEIYKEIQKRKNKSKKTKKLRYVILDRFFTTLEFDGKPTKKIIREEQKQMEFEKVKKERKMHKLNYSFENGNKNQSFEYKNKKIQFPNENQEIKKIKIHKYINSKNYGENFRYQNNDFKCPNDYYSKSLFEQINKIRCNPQSYIKYIENAKNNIIKDISGRIIYNGKIKIALNEGESAFNKAIKFLKNIKIMRKLEFNQLITIPCPQNEYDIKDINYMKYKVENIIKNGFFIKSYWREIIKDPEISFLLMIVDDVGTKSGMRRKDILNPNIKYIGISSKEINGNFACYITLSE